jgi:hypothetical protein
VRAYSRAVADISDAERGFNGYYAGSWLLDDVDDDGFNITAWQFHPLLFFCAAFFPADLGLALPIARFVPPLRADFATF